MNRLVLLCVCALTAVLWLAPTAEAVECGSPPAGGGEPVLGNLEIEESSDTEFSEDDKRLRLSFAVKGCTISNADGISAEPESSELDEELVFAEPKVIARKTQLVVRIPVDDSQFHPGKYSAVVAVTGDAINNANQKVSVQKTTPPFVPTLIAVLCALVAFLAALFVAWLKVEEPKQIQWLWLPVALALAVFAAGSIWKSSYVDVDVWKYELGTVLALTVGCATAAAGAAATFLAANKVIRKRPANG